MSTERPIVSCTWRLAQSLLSGTSPRPMALPIITAQEEQSPITATLVRSSMDLTTVIDAYAPVPMWP